MFINRELQSKVQRLVEQRPALLLTGARQVGKTELLKRTFPKHSFVNLDLPSESERADTDGFAFLKRHTPPCIIDEAQHAPGLFRPLKVAIDSDRERKGQYILSGSEKFSLMKEVSESLAGRIAIVELETLSYREIIGGGVNLPIEACVFRGGYPELYKEIDLNEGEFYSAYVATYLERDLRRLANVSSLRDYERFLRACAIRSGNLLNKSDLARDVGVSPTTINHWIGLLETSNIIQLLEPWFVNASKSIAKSPKLYFRDTGLLCFLLNLDTVEDLLRSPLLGNIWETFVYAELRKRWAAYNRASKIYFFRDRNKEIDFIVPKGGRYDVFEAKWQENPGKNAARSILEFEQLVGEGKVDSSCIVCPTSESYPIDKRIIAKGILDL